MQVELRRGVRVDGVEEPPELHAPMAVTQLADDGARPHVQRGEAVARAVPDVVVRVRLRLAGAHRQDRRRAFRRLDLGLPVHAQHERAGRRVEFESDDVAHLVDERRVPRELERLALV